MKMTFRKETDGLRSIVSQEFDFMIFPEEIHGRLLGTYFDGENGENDMDEFTVLPDLTECSCKEGLPKERVEKITTLVEQFRKTENKVKEKSWSKVINE